MSDQQRRALERAAALGDAGARLRWLGQRVLAGDLRLQRPAGDTEAWAREVMDSGLLEQNAVIRLVPRPGARPGPFDGRSWWWLATVQPDEVAWGGWSVVLVRLSRRRQARPLTYVSHKSRACNYYSLSDSEPPRALGKDDVVAWFGENLLEVRLEPLDAETVLAERKAYWEHERERFAAAPSWDPQQLLLEYGQLPKGHDRVPLLDDDAVDVKRVLVTRRSNRGRWHLVQAIDWSGTTPYCRSEGCRAQHLPGHVRWGVPTCVRCLVRMEWEGRRGHLRRFAWRGAQRLVLLGLARQRELAALAPLPRDGARRQER